MIGYSPPPYHNILLILIDNSNQPKPDNQFVDRDLYKAALGADKELKQLCGTRPTLITHMSSSQSYWFVMKLFTFFRPLPTNPGVEDQRSLIRDTETDTHLKCSWKPSFPLQSSGHDRKLSVFSALIAQKLF